MCSHTVNNESHNTTKKKKFVSLMVMLKALDTINYFPLNLVSMNLFTIGDWWRNHLILEQCSSKKHSEQYLFQKSITKFIFKNQVMCCTSGLHNKHWWCFDSGPILQEKALFFRNKLRDGDVNFAARVGWLDKWKKRYGVRQLDVYREKLSDNSESVPEFILKL